MDQYSVRANPIKGGWDLQDIDTARLVGHYKTKADVVNALPSITAMRGGIVTFHREDGGIITKWTYWPVRPQSSSIWVQPRSAL